MKRIKFLSSILIISFCLSFSSLGAQRLPQSPWVDGALIKAINNPNTFVMYNNHKYQIPNPVTFENLGFSWDKVQTRDSYEIANLSWGGYIPHSPPGCLIRERDTQTVYIIFEGKKHAIPDMQTARDLRGDNWNSYIILWPKGVIDVIPKGSDMPKSSSWGEHEFYGGHCTWYVSLKRKIPWGGNANQWYSNSKGAGFFSGEGPIPGSIMATSDWTFGHVAFVENVSWDNDGKWISFQISEMNWGVARKGYEELGRTVNYNITTRRYFTREKPPNPKTLLGFIY